MAKTNSKAPAPRTRVLVVDDHPVVRDGLAALLGTEPDLEVCGEAEDVPGALALLKAARPDVAIIDVSLKNGNGIDLVKRIRAHEHAVRVLVWSMYPEELYAERALRAGAQGYVHKGRSTKEILEALRAVLAGKVYLSGDQADRLLRRLVGGGAGAERAPVECLSDRELEAFGLMGQGRTTEQIAAAMHVSPKTVETYRARIKEKLGLDNITELIQRATRWVVENR
ncbi:response regulator transcription factor [Frigoriglobus tundricola]|uniref:Two-component transcriptional response regulator, NarL/FixJ family n=1 Tax=Frigoriglobus tundricola TaxID=2774151 RepID=A0A6M5YLS6_9BACT|nr:response regulator transcription factor [Frigoriglobus tundricola]QJW94987.1 Two-component transcriptional response regulator, NarL/FixJ family [Frigoriglobus tundricola]